MSEDLSGLYEKLAVQTEALHRELARALWTLPEPLQELVAARLVTIRAIRAAQGLPPHPVDAASR